MSVKVFAAWGKTPQKLSEEPQTDLEQVVSAPHCMQQHPKTSRAAPWINAKEDTAIKTTRLMFANSFTDKPLPLWDNVVCTDETKAELHGNAVHLFIDKVNPVRKGTPYPQLKHGGGSSRGPASLPLALEVKSEEYCTSVWNLFQKTRFVVEVLSLSEGQWPTVHSQKHKRMFEKEKMGCYELSTGAMSPHLPYCNSHWKPLESTETCLCNKKKK